MKAIKKIIVFTVLINFFAQSYGAINNDKQSWNNITILANFNSDIRFWFESQARLGCDISKLSQYMLRTAIGHNINNDHSVWIGYAWIDTNKPFSDSSVQEHRLWQQYLYIRNFNFGKFSSRTRLEQRVIEHNSKTAWRFRQFLRLQFPIPFTDNKKYFFSTYNEGFLNLNNTINNGNNSGFEQNRLFLGAGFNPNKISTIEFGYQHQFINRINQKNFIGHAIALSLTLIQ